MHYMSNGSKFYFGGDFSLNSNKKDDSLSTTMELVLGANIYKKANVSDILVNQLTNTLTSEYPPSPSKSYK